jgi:hypothetical protein
VFSAASFDGHVGVYNLHACTLTKVTETMNADFTVTQTVTGQSRMEVPVGRGSARFRVRAAEGLQEHGVQVTTGAGGKQKEL